MKSGVEEIAASLPKGAFTCLLRAYAERLDGDTGPMSTEAWYLAYDTPEVKALERRRLTKFKTFKKKGFPTERWRLLSDLGIQVAVHVVEKYEITWGPKR